MAETVYLAADLGASSGRVLAGRFDGRTLCLDEVHRFENGPVHVGPRTYWDVLALWQQLQVGFRAATARYSGQIRSVGVDTWGVDFALLGRGDELLGNPRHYRDRHTDGVVERACGIAPREEIFAHTGLQFMQFNSLFQLLAMKWDGSPLLEQAEQFLMMPDLFHWLLTGVKSNEFTNATTSQCLNPATGKWAIPLLEKLELPAQIFGDIAMPGATLGSILPDVALETGLSGVAVVLPGTHDTASAVMAVPASAAAATDDMQPDWCYISSGTWSLMGVESPRPVINDLCRQLNFTNEGGIGGTIRLLKNITGLWLVQECRRVWAQQGQNRSWDELNGLADAAPPRKSFIDPDHVDFMAPSDMPAAIQDFCRRTGQPVPESPGAVIRCAIDSLALKCRRVLGWLEQLIGGRLETIHIVGGGTQNRRLCQATADACGRRVLAGPVEATALGNVLVQAIAAGEIGDVRQAREVVRSSFPLDEYLPRETPAWDEAYARFERLPA